MRHLPLLPRFAAALIAMLAVAAAAPANAKPMHLLGTEPRPNQVMSGSGVAFALHFDHPLDHQASRFMLVEPNGARRTVPVRLEAQPSVLYGSMGQLPSGNLHVELVRPGERRRRIKRDFAVHGRSSPLNPAAWAPPFLRLLRKQNQSVTNNRTPAPDFLSMMVHAVHG